MTKSKSPKALVLRTCNADMTSYGGFKWPESGIVKCPDWSDSAICGNGLHGALWGQGEGSLLDFSPDAKWLVVEVAQDQIVDLCGKVKFPRGKVLYAGDRLTATQMIQAKCPGAAIIGGTATAGYGGIATAGYGGIATAGNGGTATAGDRGTATAGNGGIATAGNGGIATAGYGGTATAGDRGIIQIKWFDGIRYRLVTGYVGEDGIEANVSYVVNSGKLVKKV